MSKKVIFSVPAQLDERIMKYLETWGFMTKAEFFRHAAITYLDRNEKQTEARKMGVRLPLTAF